MDPATISSSLQTALGANLPSILAAIGILIVGWLAAVAIRVGVRHLLRMVRLNSRIADQTERKIDAELASRKSPSGW
jgi:hypothetical protein